MSNDQLWSRVDASPCLTTFESCRSCSSCKGQAREPTVAGRTSRRTSRRRKHPVIRIRVDQGWCVRISHIQRTEYVVHVSLCGSICRHLEFLICACSWLGQFPCPPQRIKVSTLFWKAQLEGGTTGTSDHRLPKASSELRATEHWVHRTKAPWGPVAALRDCHWHAAKEQPVERSVGRL